MLLHPPERMFQGILYVLEPNIVLAVVEANQFSNGPQLYRSCRQLALFIHNELLKVHGLIHGKFNYCEKPMKVGHVLAGNPFFL